MRVGRRYQGTVVFIDHRSGSERTVRIDLLTFKAEGFHSPANVQFQGRVQALPVQISGRIGSIAGLITPATPWPVELTAQAAGMDISVSGSLRKPADLAGFDLSVTAKGADLANLQQITGALFPLSGPFTISGRLTDPEAGSWTVSDIAATLGEGRIAGALSVKAGVDRPFIEMTLASERLDLRPLLRSEGYAMAGRAAAPRPQRSQKVFSADPFDFSWLRRADVSARVDVAHLLLPTLAADDVHGTAMLEAGRLRLQPLSAVVGGGRLELDLSLDARTPAGALDASLKVNGLDVQAMLKALRSTEPVDGLLNLDIKAHTAGASQAAWMAQMNGDVIAVVKKGRIPSKYWEVFGEDLSTLLTRLPDSLAQPTTVTEVECLVLDFNVVDGMTHSDVMLLVTDRMLATGVGEVNLKDEKLRFAFKPKPRDNGSSELTGGFGFSLGGLSEPFVLTGTLSDPALSISTTDAAKTLVKAVGGALLLGPVGLAAVFLEHSSSNADPCRRAIEAAGKGPYKTPSPASSPRPKKQTDNRLKRFGSSIEDFFTK